jgi:hypothetical protein
LVCGLLVSAAFPLAWFWSLQGSFIIYSHLFFHHLLLKNKGDITALSCGGGGGGVVVVGWWGKGV